MEVKIGVQHAARELIVDTADSAEEVEGRLQKALADDSTFSLVDIRGRQIVIPARSVAYVEIGGGSSGQVGFRG